MEEKKSSNAQIKASIKYNQANVQQFKMNFNVKTDIDIIEYLKTKDNKQGYIKSLIRADMEAQKK